MTSYTIWIEAERWSSSIWTPDDANSDVIVTFADGTRWVATCFSYQNIATITAKNQSSGECLGGTYYWASDMLLVDAIQRSHIERIVQHLLDLQSFPRVFRQLSPEVESDDQT